MDEVFYSKATSAGLCTVGECAERTERPGSLPGNAGPSFFLGKELAYKRKTFRQVPAKAMTGALRVSRRRYDSPRNKSGRFRNYR